LLVVSNEQQHPGLDFPQVPPVLRFINPGVSHPWLDAQGRVVGLNELYTWFVALLFYPSIDFLFCLLLFVCLSNDD